MLCYSMPDHLFRAERRSASIMAPEGRWPEPRPPHHTVLLQGASHLCPGPSRYSYTCDRTVPSTPSGRSCCHTVQAALRGFLRFESHTPVHTGPTLGSSGSTRCTMHGGLMSPLCPTTRYSYLSRCLTDILSLTITLHSRTFWFTCSRHTPLH